MTNTKLSGLLAYPAEPKAIGQCANLAITQLNGTGAWQLEAWEHVDNWGKPLIEPILNRINEHDVLIADITRLNFNVLFEVGFAIGAQKRVLLVINSSLESDERRFKEIGIFDTLGYKKYENSTELVSLLASDVDITPIHFSNLRDTAAPIFVLEKPSRTDQSARIVSRIKKSYLRYRSFVPSEEARLSAVYAIEHAAKSVSLVVPLCSKEERDSESHNLRAAFLAGLGLGMGRNVLLLNPRENPAPLDVRDYVVNFTDIEEIDEYVNDLIYRTYDYLHNRTVERKERENLLADLSVGDPMAENEFATLGNYYIRTDEFSRAKRGEVNLVVGRKGTGKTALWAQLRDDIRRDSAKVVVDLAPEGYQLLELKERVLLHLGTGAKSHLITAFWEYLLYLELAYKLLEKDVDRHRRDRSLYEKYLKLEKFFQVDQGYPRLGDFSERLKSLTDRLVENYQRDFSDKGDQALSAAEITELLYSKHLRELREAVVEYLLEKEEVWILFDNLDKGWATHGLAREDVFILRCLLDAGRKIRNDVRREMPEFHVIVFIRNDIYQLLMDETPDFGKEMRASLDWQDAQMLKNVLSRRLRSVWASDASLEEIWPQVCIPYFKNQQTIDLFVGMSLMRPRNLLKLFSYCRGVAVNREKSKIEEDEIEKGVAAYSDDILIDCSNELRDLCAESRDILYRFIGEKAEYRHSELKKIAKAHGIPNAMIDPVIEYMIYYGIFGIVEGYGAPTYIFDVGYDIKKMRSLVGKSDSARYCLHPALQPSLGIKW